MQRDNFSCIDCGSEEKTLNVHHVYYESGKSVWDYPDYALVTLCSECHETEHSVAFNSEKELIENLKRIGIRSSEIGSMAFTVECVRSNLGQQKAKALFELIDFLTTRASFDERVMERIIAIIDETKPVGFENAESNHP